MPCPCKHVRMYLQRRPHAEIPCGLTMTVDRAVGGAQYERSRCLIWPSTQMISWRRARSQPDNPEQWRSWTGSAPQRGMINEADVRQGLIASRLRCAEALPFCRPCR